jgi:tetratricopeptide (TPR) repeat protein
LYPLLELTTALDPRFNIAYRFGAVFLAEPYPNGPGRSDLAIALLEKGLRERPDKWEYMQDIGFVHYWYGHDYKAAAEAFRKASEVPGAPWWLRSLAATTLVVGGDRQSSRLMWEAIRQSAENDWLRHDAERRLLQLRALDDIDALQRAVDDYTRRAGQPPRDWGAFVRAGAIRGVPLDPGRTPYELTDGRVHLSRSSSLFPLPTEPGRQMTPPSS